MERNELARVDQSKSVPSSAPSSSTDSHDIFGEAGGFDDFGEDGKQIGAEGVDSLRPPSDTSSADDELRQYYSTDSTPPVPQQQPDISNDNIGNQLSVADRHAASIDVPTNANSRYARPVKYGGRTYYRPLPDAFGEQVRSKSVPLPTEGGDSNLRRNVQLRRSQSVPADFFDIFEHDGGFDGFGEDGKDSLRPTSRSTSQSDTVGTATSAADNHARWSGTQRSSDFPQRANDMWESTFAHHVPPNLFDEVGKPLMDGMDPDERKKAVLNAIERMHGGF